MDFDEKILLNLTNKELNDVFNDIDIMQNKIHLQFKRIACVLIYNYLKKKQNISKVILEKHVDTDTTYLYFFIFDEDGEELHKESTELAEMIYTYKEMITDLDWTCEFKNNPEERNQLFTYFLGSNGLKWKKDQQNLILKEKLENNLEVQNLSSKIGKKI